MVVGYNYPWAFEDYGFNFGPNPHNLSQTVPRWKYTLPRNLQELKAIGIKVVRWFILANGFNYGTAPTLLWLPPKGQDWSFDPPTKLDPLFKDHFELMLKTFKQYELRVIPSLIDFHFFGPGTYTSKEYAACGRADIANDSTKRDHFFKTVLDEFLDISKSYRDQIFAWEVMNEPVWNTVTPAPHRKIGQPDVDEVTMKDFLNSALNHIHALKFDSTVGHRFFSDLSKFPTGTHPQFHYYAHWIMSSDPKHLPDHPEAFLGEFGSEHPNQHSGSIADEPWADCNGADKDSNKIVFERLKVLARKGYKLALVWPDQKDDGTDSLKLSPNKRANLKQFTLGKFPNGVP
jgi:hypothetical protein